MRKEYVGKEAVTMLSLIFESIVHELKKECVAFYCERLVSFCLHGSAARGTINNFSNIDFLPVVESLPDGRLGCVEEFGI